MAKSPKNVPAQKITWDEVLAELKKLREEIGGFWHLDKWVVVAIYGVGIVSGIGLMFWLHH